MAKLLIVYDSQTGNTEKMAEAVAEGARFVSNAEVEVKYYARPEELTEADGIARALGLGIEILSNQPKRRIEKKL